MYIQQWEEDTKLMIRLDPQQHLCRQDVRKPVHVCTYLCSQWVHGAYTYIHVPQNGHLYPWLAGRLPRPLEHGNRGQYALPPEALWLLWHSQLDHSQQHVWWCGDQLVWPSTGEGGEGTEGWGEVSKTYMCYKYFWFVSTCTLNMLLIRKLCWPLFEQDDCCGDKSK